MNHFKNLVIITTLCIMGSTNTKQMRRAEPKTFTELINFVKTAPNVWDANSSMLSEQFVNTLKNGARQAGLEKAQFNILIDMASSRAPFSGNAQKDKLIANNYAGQKEDIVQEYASLMGQPVQQPSQTDDTNMTAFIQGLIETNNNSLKDFATPTYVFKQADTNDIFGPITSALKQQYPGAADQQKAKTILIEKIKATFPGVEQLTTRWGSMLNFINLNIPSQQQ